MRAWIPILTLGFCALVWAQEITPPAQPASGPGGAEVTHKSVIKRKYGGGSGEYWLYEPADPKAASAPVIVFCHGWGATNPKLYGAWIDHLVKRGNIVIFPRYQADRRTPTHEFTANILAAVKAALSELKQGKDHVRPEAGKLAVAGHSVGGLLAANLAAGAGQAGLPAFAGVMCVEPARTWNSAEMANVTLSDLSLIPAGTLLLAVAGDADTVARDIDAKRIYHEATQIPVADKDFIVLNSDHHGQPPLLAQHGAPAAPDDAYDNGETSERDDANGGGPLRQRLRDRIRARAGQGGAGEERAAAVTVNALDFFGAWKLFDGLTDAAFYGKNREFALGSTRQQKFMGVWSDGVPVKELTVTDEP